MEYYSAIKRNTFESLLMKWMNLEPIMQSEVSQKEKCKYCILTHKVSEVAQSCPPFCNPMGYSLPCPSVHGVAKSRTRLSVFTFTFHFHPLEKEMATHSSVLAWRIPGMGEPGGLPSMGSHRVGHD